MKITKILLAVCRILLGLAFVFSGFTKGVDPMGWAIQMGEYFNAYGLDLLRGSENCWAIALPAVEWTLGWLLVVGMWPRVSATAVFVMMLFFSGLTLHIALTNPVTDCGCFGEVLKLTNWQSFWKNAALLLPLSIVTLLVAWRMPRRSGYKASDNWAAPIIFVLPCLGVGLWALTHLPILDFLPYKAGTDLLAAPARPAGETLLLYKNIHTGQQREFTLADTTWYDESTWEYVDTILPDGAAAPAESFAILDAGRDVTRALLDTPGPMYLFCVSDPATMNESVRAALERAAQAAPLAIALTPAPLAAGQTFYGLPCYNMDDTTLKSLLRADYGLVILERGVIKKKYRWSDIP